MCGPGSKPLLFALLLAIGADVAVPRPSWVSYTAQARVIGVCPHFVPTPPGEGGICDPAALDRAVSAARAAGRRIGSVIVTLPDNPTGQLAQPATVRALCEVAARHDLLIISDEIYRDLVYDTAPPFASPAGYAPERTVVTTALSKSLALGGRRVGVARLPGGIAGRVLRDRLLGIGSEIWSAAAAPIQHAAALAFTEPSDLTERIARSRALHAAVCRAVAGIFAAAGVAVRPPQAAFYLYPDFAAWRVALAVRHEVTTGAGLADHLLDRYGMGVLPGSVFGDHAGALRIRVATGLLYADTDAQRECALAPPTRSPSPGSPPPWTGSRRSWPISPAATVRARHPGGRARAALPALRRASVRRTPDRGCRPGAPQIAAAGQRREDGFQGAAAAAEPLDPRAHLLLAASKRFITEYRAWPPRSPRQRRHGLGDGRTGVMAAPARARTAWSCGRRRPAALLAPDVAGECHDHVPGDQAVAGRAAVLISSEPDREHRPALVPLRAR